MPMSRTVLASAVEKLETRRLLSAVYPSAYEQYAVELINRARANPAAEAARYKGYQDSAGDTYNGDLNEGLAPGTISPAAKQPVAINPFLTDAARKHSQWMTDHSTFSHFENGITPGQREVAAGYDSNAASNYGENIGANYSSTPLTNFTGIVVSQHRDLFTDQTEADRGHRTNMMDANRNEIGVGMIVGRWIYPNYGLINSFAQTADTSSQGKIFLTGVSYKDSVAKDNFYTPGEGLAGVTVVATRQSDGKQFTTTTWDSGGYSLPVQAGTYDVQFHGGGLAPAVYHSNVKVTTQNVKVDGVAGVSDAVPPSAIFGQITSKKLIITGTDGADTISADVLKGRWVVTMNGTTLSWNGPRARIIGIFGMAGNDKITIGPNIRSSSVEGGEGNDRIVGNDFPNGILGDAGNDTLYGNGGNDLLMGGDGDDRIYGGDGNDRIYGDAGNDVVDAGAGNDRVYGGDGNDLLAGAVGRDILYGESGADTLNGGKGSDYTDFDPLDTRVLTETHA